MRTCVVDGKDDWVNWDGLKEDLRGDLMGAEWLTLDETGHFGLLERPERVGERLEEFLKSFKDNNEGGDFDLCA